MKILWFTWKDRKNPLTGGAEVVNEELAKRLVADGNEVIFLVAGFEGSNKEEIVNGYRIIRLGNRYTVYWEAFKYYRKNLVGWADLVIDEMNTVPFFAKFYVKEKNIILSYQLCREIWFYQMFFPLSLIGYLLEPIYLLLLKDRIVLTESESAKIDFQRYGFKKESVFVFPVGLEYEPISEEEFGNQKKEANPTILYFGSIREMKRPDHVLKAFEIAKKAIPELKLFIAGVGKGEYAEKFSNSTKNSQFSKDICYLGKISNEEKIDLMKRVHLICVTSVKEGWGLIITEANSQGTPAAVYDVDGLRDACKDNETGLLCKDSPDSLAKNIIRIFKDRDLYEKYRLNAWKDSFNYNNERSYKIFMGIINNVLK